MTAAELLYACETDILEAIARLLGRGSVESADWKIDRLSRMGGLEREVLTIVKGYRDAIASGTATEVEKAALDVLVRGEAAARQAKAMGADVRDVLPADVDPAIRAIVEQYQLSAKDSMNQAMSQLAQNAGQVYADAVSKAALAVMTGAESGQEALVQTIREWSREGIGGFYDRAGRKWTTEAYANMVIRTSERRVATDAMFARGDEYGTDLIEVSSHAGARPGCAPYQGRIYSRSGTSENYPSLDSTSYGEPAGLFGINCSHVAYPYWEGVSIKRNEPTENTAKNDAEYAYSQKQRAYERSIRSAKRDLKAMEALGDEAGIRDAKELVRDRQAAMREFIEDSGRTRRYGREQIYD